MDERESSVASSTDFYETETKPAPSTCTGAAVNAGTVAKRKAGESSSAQDKRRKRHSSSSPVSSDLRPCVGLPPAVWQHVFLFCSLADLGRLMQVNRSFFSYLTDVRNVSVSKPDSSTCLRLLKSESVWASARNALSPRPPKPLAGLSELQMWQLAWSKTCQFCSKLGVATPSDDIWQQGPGNTGVRAIWPFGIKTCGPCLLRQCQTDSSLLFSQTASALRPGLPFALITKDGHHVPAHVVQSKAPPLHVDIGKYYYKPQVEEMKREFNEAFSLGPAAAEEWSKGLEDRGKERMKMAEHWERWEGKYRPEPKKRAASVAATASDTALSSRSPVRQPSPVIHTPIPMPPTSQYAHARPPTVPPQIFTPQPGQTGSTQPSHQRNLHDANEAKASRKTDIERRCQQMNPPIPPSVLRHMESFKAAIQISQPMNDYAWSVLEPRLIAQLPAAQQAEAEHVSRVASSATKPAERRYQDANSKEAKETMDREWEEAQRSIRDKLNAIADEFIIQDWDHGKAVTYENSPKFAADVLIYVRRMYLGTVSTEEASRETLEGSDNTNSADNNNRPKLVLENMKWVYDNKIKPLTEQFRKDLYLCSASNCDSGTRYYGFEGIVQHFGAKHTHAFSSGNVVVAWRDAAWPEETPFHPDPISIKHAYHASNASGYGYFGGYSRAGTSTPHMPSHLPQASPGPYQYGGQYNGPFPPPQATGPAITGFEYAQQYPAPLDGYSYQTMGPPGYGTQMGGPSSYMPSPALANPTAPPPPAMPPPAPPVQVAPGSVPDPSEDTSYSTSLFDKQVSTIIGMAPDIWKHTSGIKDMPNSLRVYVLLHRVISRFHIEFNHEPSLSHFIDAFSNHEVPKSLKHAPGLSCKACQVETPHQLTGAHYAKPMDRKTFNVSTLLSHFRNQHLPSQHYGFNHGQQSAMLDWKEDMIELPSERFISGLIHAPGMDDDKLLMIATVFPSLFPMPLPKIRVIDNNGPDLATTKDARDLSAPTGPTVEATLDKPTSASKVSTQIDSPKPTKPLEEEYDPQRPALHAKKNDDGPGVNAKQHASRDSPSLGDRRQRYYNEPRYYMSRDHMDDGYGRPREYVDYAPSPRMIHAGPAYSDYAGRRTVFREHERIYGPPTEDVLYAHAREGSHGREYGTYPRQVRYYEDEDPPSAYHYTREPQPREESPLHGQSAADRFLEDFVPGPSATVDAIKGPGSSQTANNKPPVPGADSEEGARYTTPPPPSASISEEPGLLRRPLAAPQAKAPSIVSNGSRYEDHRANGRHNPTPDSTGPPPRRVGPHRRRDRPHEQRMPSRYYRYMSVARDDPYGRASSMSRSQSRRYEEQRRRIDQQETPQPHADSEYEPAYSRDHSVEHVSPEDDFYHRPAGREYVSVQDRLHAYSPPRYHYNEPRGPPPMYVDEYGNPIHEYEVVRVRGEPRHSRAPYIPYTTPSGFEQGRYEYVPVSYDRSAPQRYNSRGEYIYYGERERALPRRTAQETDAEAYEPAPPEVKVESAPIPMPEIA